MKIQINLEVKMDRFEEAMKELSKLGFSGWSNPNGLVRNDYYKAGYIADIAWGEE